MELTPPEGFVEELDAAITAGWQVALGEDGWSDDYGVPRYEFNSGDAANYVVLENVGLFLRAAAALKESGVITESELNEKIASAADQALNWQWVPAGTSWGAADNVSFPVGGVSHVLSSTQGIVGANNECEDVSVPFNQWFFVKNSRATQETTTGVAAAMASGLIASSALNLENKDNYLTAGRSLAANLIDLVVTDEDNDFGVKQSQVTYESLDSKVPLGLMPGELRLYGNDDTASCSDGAFVKFQRGYKHEAALSALVFAQMHELTGEQNYADAVKEIIDGVLVLRECDGFIHSYYRVHTPAAADTKCYPTGEDNFNAYPTYLVTDHDMESSYDTITTLYYLNEAEKGIYSKYANFKDSLDWVRKIEGEYSGVGMQRKSGFVVRHAANVISLERRAEGQAMMASMFARAACENKADAELRQLYADTAVEAARDAMASAQTDFPKKPANAFAKRPGGSLIALKALAEVREIFTVGCSTAPDLDEDGYYNDPNEGDFLDCDDNNASINPNATEVCNLVDDDCDGETDEGFDEDEDGYSVCQGDCKDDDADVNPGAGELPDNHLDDNCNKKVDERTYLVSTLDENDEKMVDVNVFFYLSSCAEEYEGSFERVKNNCGRFAYCVSSKVGVCSLALEPKDYTVFFQDKNGEIVSKRFNLPQITSTTLELKKIMVIAAPVDENVGGPDVNAATPVAASFDLGALFGDESGMVIMLVIVLAVVLILVAVIVILVLVYFIKFKGKGGGGSQTKLFVKPKPKPESTTPLGFDGVQ